VNRGAGRLPGLIGFDPNRAATYDGGATVRTDVQVGENGRLIAEEEGHRGAARRDVRAGNTTCSPSARTALAVSHTRSLVGSCRVSCAASKKTC
jgi:hypothetical protein